MLYAHNQSTLAATLLPCHLLRKIAGVTGYELQVHHLWIAAHARTPPACTLRANSVRRRHWPVSFLWSSPANAGYAVRRIDSRYAADLHLSAYFPQPAPR